MKSPSRPRLILAVLDGWGHAAAGPGNAVAACATGHIQELAGRYPTALLEASGAAVGLPAGVMGNSEVGHLTLGAGCVIRQDLTLINASLACGAGGNLVLTGTMEACRRSGATLHFLGLASDAGVHSDLAHLRTLVASAVEAGVARIRVHAFTDGRDTPPSSGLGYIQGLDAELRAQPTDARLATISGRYFAMDRDQRWARLEKAWQALVHGQGRRAASPTAAVEEAYARGQTDEFIEPTIIEAVGRGQLARGDHVIFFNFRADRARQLTHALTQDGFAGFPRPDWPRLASFVCMTRYDESLDLPVAFASEEPGMVLGDLFSTSGTSQVRIAETEKYAHVTYFLNGGVERPYPGEERILVPSPGVATYDLQPEMSAHEVLIHVEEKIHGGNTDVIVVNFANADMVGHTGNLAATVRACGVVDAAIGRIHAAARASGSLLVVTADHGNAEQMLDTVTGNPHTAHTTNPVPAIFARDDLPGTRLADGMGLSSVLPTILKILGMNAPATISAPSLF